MRKIGIILAILMAASVTLAQNDETQIIENSGAETQSTETIDPSLNPLEQREAAELRVEEQMVEMNNLTEALSRNLGQLHYLRTLCFGSQDQKWREYATHMMNLETGADTARRRSLVKAFNNGYYQEKDRFSACSGAVSVDAAAISENARQISTMLGDPFREF